VTIAPSQCEVVGSAARRYWRTRDEWEKIKERGASFEEGNSVFKRLSLSRYSFFLVGIVFSGGIDEMACSQRPILAALGENWKNGKKEREREGRIEEKEREGERGRDEGEQSTRTRPEKTPSNGPIESSNWPWTLRGL
jgi:hypothetical protein